LSENQTDAFGEDATEQLDITDADSEVAEMEVAVENSASAATTVSEESKLLSADAQEIEAQKRKVCIVFFALITFLQHLFDALIPPHCSANHFSVHLFARGCAFH